MLMDKNALMDTKTIATRGLKGIYGMFLKDLNALPEEAFGKCLGGKARTVADIVYETNMVTDHVGLTIRGEELFPWPEGWITAPADFQTKDVVIAAFEKSTQKFIDTIEGMTSEQLEEPLMDEGKETTRYERARFVTLHIWYHSGQLNFIQTLLGDDTWHWV